MDPVGPREDGACIRGVGRQSEDLGRAGFGEQGIRLFPVERHDGVFISGGKAAGQEEEEGAEAKKRSFHAGQRSA